MMRISSLVLLVLVSLFGFYIPYVYSDSYQLSTGGVTTIVSTRTEKKITTTKNPSGLRYGNIELYIDKESSEVVLKSGEIGLSDFHVQLGSGFFQTDFDAMEAVMNIHNVAKGVLTNNKVRLVSSSAEPSVETSVQFNNCSGTLCFVVSGLDLNLKQYTVDLSFSDDMEVLQGRVNGVTKNGSTLAMVFSANRKEEK